MKTSEDILSTTSPTIKVGDCVRRKDGSTHNGIIDRYRWDGQCWIVVHPLLHFGLIKKTGQFQEWGSFYPVYSITPLGRLVLASMN